VTSAGLPGRVEWTALSVQGAGQQAAVPSRPRSLPDTRQVRSSCGRAARNRSLPRPPVHCGVLGLRFFGCQRCDTVYAGPEPPPRCTDCAGDEFAELTERLQGDTYFSSPDSR